MKRSHRLTIEDWNGIAPGFGDWIVEDVHFLSIVRSMLDVDPASPEDFESLLVDARAADEAMYVVPINSSRFLEDLSGAIAFLNGPDTDDYMRRYGSSNMPPSV